MKLVLNNSIAGVTMVALALLGFLLDIAGLLGVTGTLADLVQAAFTLLGIMGLRDVMLAEQQKIKDAIADFRSSTFWGTVLSLFVPIFLDPGSFPGLPGNIVDIFEVVGQVMMAFGIVDAGKRGKFSKR